MSGYSIILEPDSNETLLVTCPALPELTTFGETEADARRRALDAVEEALAARMARRVDLPAPERHPAEPAVHLPSRVLMKLALHEELRRQGLSRAELMRRLGWQRESVDRLFRLDRQSRTDQMDEALAALGRRYDIASETAADEPEPRHAEQV